jgi:CubicO group peptidase (beta-lactamase class C family)
MDHMVLICEFITMNVKRLAAFSAILLILTTYGCSTYQYGTLTTSGWTRENVDLNIVHAINEFRTDVSKLMKKGKIPGCSMALVDKQGIIWSEGFGTTDYKRNIPATPNTLFYLGSIGKTYTAIAILLAVQDGLLVLDEPIITYVPEFKVYSRYEANPEEKITLRHLLSHCAGIPHESPDCNMLEVTDSFEDRVTSLYGTWLKCPVGAGYAYSGAGYDLAAYVLQRATDIPFEQYVTNRIFQPLGLHHSTVGSNAMSSNTNQAVGHTIGIAEQPSANGLIGAGGICASATDLAQFMRLLMNKGTLDGKRFIDESLISAMLTPHAVAYEKTPQDEYEWLYGLGVLFGKKQIGNGDVHILQHSGEGGGYQTLYEYYPEYGISAVVLTNRLPHSVLGDLIIGRRLIKQGVLEKCYSAPSWDIQQCTPKWNGWVKHTPTEYRAEWKKYCGMYKGRISGYRIKWWAKLALKLNLDQYTPRIKVYEKKGYLCLTESRFLQQMNHHPYPLVDQKLEEVKPGLFFTASGSALDLRGEIPTWRNYKLKKI